MKEDLGTLINHKIRLDGTLDTNIFKILFAIITAMTRLKIIFVVGSIVCSFDWGATYGEG